MGAYKEPHGGDLKNLYLPAKEAEVEKQAAREFASWDLTERQRRDQPVHRNQRAMEGQADR